MDKKPSRFSASSCAEVFRRWFLGLGFMTVGVLLLLSNRTVGRIVEVEKWLAVGFGQCNYEVTYEYYFPGDGKVRRDSRLTKADCDSPPFAVGERTTVSYDARSGKLTLAGGLLADSLPATAVFALALGALTLTWPLLMTYLMRVAAILKAKWFHT